MGPAPREIGGAKIIACTPIDRRHRHTGDCRQVVGGALRGPAAGLAIGRYDGQEGFYLLGCDGDWSTITDTWHPTIDEAMRQAEFEYEGVTETWQHPA